MKQVLIRRGQAVVEEVPAPGVERGTLLVQVEASCISVGTELSGIRQSGQPLWKKALNQPQKVRAVLQTVAAQGLQNTRSQIEGKLAAGEPTGYSAAGVVLAVGEGVEDLRPGDRVACAGSQCAHHAEVIRVPRNLCVPVPEGLDAAAASTVTLGAIALQGVRRAGPTLGETFVVIGLGILGQLTVQLLRANGCRVIGTDLDPERIRLARAHGLEVGLNPAEDGDVAAVARLTGGIGADGVIITAATPSDAVMAAAFGMCRKKGRVVLVGDVGLHLNRADFYAKELDFFISSSYGPGRYDRAYEEEGLDYPVGYVRWTENRNMAEYLRQVAEGRVEVAPLLSATFPVAEAAQAYEALRAPGAKPMMVILTYPPAAGAGAAAAAAAAGARAIANPHAKAARPGQLRVALVGAGGFAKGMHLPNLQSLSEHYQLHAVVSRTGHNAMATAKQFGAQYATTDYARVLADPEVDVVLIATRHDLHARQALAALEHGKHVLVEKPLALTQGELDEIAGFFGALPADAPTPVLLTGFNRRFSPYARRMAELVRGRTNPMIANYRMNAGYIPLDHWVHTAEGGGRNLGEACHIYDLFTFLTDARVEAVQALPIRPATGFYSATDNFVATVRFTDGSVGTLTYTALGAREHPKEQMELFGDGAVVTLDDYRRLSVAGRRGEGLTTRTMEKGQREELLAFARAIKEGGPWPIPLWQQVQASEIALAVEARLRP
ncbi:MAG TPA: bi-domain-containing oxidoreductase [Gemmatimonadales bacterium]|nr:bi-domain-containing oxidoreductase [Gemmatimonadales bacterium]